MLATLLHFCSLQTPQSTKTLVVSNIPIADVYRILSIVDDYFRVCVEQLVDVSISGAHMARYLNQLKDSRVRGTGGLTP